jgi:hypothetical protein
MSLSTLGNFTPVPLVPIHIPIFSNDGSTVEIINDSAYLLTVNMNGSTSLEAGGKQIYAVPPGGVTVNITPQYSYLSVPWATNTVIVNLYNPGDLLSRNYPLNIYRGGYSSNTCSAYLKIQSATGGTISLPTPPAGQNAFLTGFDFIATTVSTASECIVSFHNLVTVAAAPDNGHITYHFVQNTVNEVEILRTFPQAVMNADDTQPITCVVTNFNVGSTGTLVIYGYIQ